MRLILKGLFITLSFLVGFLLIVPVTYFFPKQRNRICIIGRDKGLFLDNAKYIYLYLLNQEKNSSFDIFFLTEDKYTYNLLLNNNLPVIFYPTFKALYKMTTSRVLIVDNYHWIFNLKYFLLFFCYKIQLWHGIGFKKLGRVLVYDENELPIGRKIREFLGLYLEQLLPNYDLFISTSDFYTDKVFRPAFRMKSIENTGYPRNDILHRNNTFNRKHSLINTDEAILQSVKKLKEDGYKIILYAPTFRDSEKFNNNDDKKTLDTFFRFCQNNRIKLILKFHPDFIDTSILKDNNHIQYKNSCDIYPVLPLTDLLITDYSSIYMDYLHLNKPIIFYPYDLDEYIKNSRSIQFEYDWITT